MMAKKKRPVRWVDVMASNGGNVRDIGAVIGFVSTWAATQQALGRDDISIEDYARDWSTSEATAYRHLRRFRRLLPGFPYPTEFVEVVGVDLRQAVPTQYLDGWRPVFGS